MEFTPKTEKQIQEESLAPNGVYDFRTIKSVNAISKAGNEMIEITVALYKEGGLKNRINDYLMPSMAAKLRHYCDSVGLLAEYEQGSLTAEMCGGKEGKCKVAIKIDKTGGYPPKNEIKDYICRNAKPLASESIHKNMNDEPPPIEDDGSIPF